MFDKAYWQAAEKYRPEAAPEPRRCEAPGCDQLGEHRAPKSPTELRSYRWFCLPHVQEYNKQWDYYKGKNPAQIEYDRREDVVGQRPTWPLGHLHAQDVDKVRRAVWARFFSRGQPKSHAYDPEQHKGTPALTDEEQTALGRLGLRWPVSLYEVKQRYRAMVKKHHPDHVAATAKTAKEKDAAEELIKLINRAYAVLKKKLGN